jgi:hypothetical protein
MVPNYLWAFVIADDGWSEYSSNYFILWLSVSELAAKYAPAIWFHSSEAFYPSSVEFFLSAVRLLDERGNVVQEDVTADSIPGGNDTAKWHLTTKQPLG